MPTKKELRDAAALILGKPNKKQKIKKELIKGNNKYKNNPDKKDKRDKITKDILKDTEFTSDEVEQTLVEMYDDLVILGLVKPRA